MNELLARYRLRVGLQKLEARRADVHKRERYLRGDFDLPFAPDGVNEEYIDLQKQSLAPYFGIAVNAPVQRLRAEGIDTSLNDDDDRALWLGAWKANFMDTRQERVYRSMLLHSRGIVSVWPNDANRAQPIVRPESFDLVHVEMDPDDPYTPEWAVKSYTATGPATLQEGMLGPISPTGQSWLSVAIVYDATSFMRFERPRAAGEWEVVLQGSHPLQAVPFALYDYKIDDHGVPWSSMDALIPQQDAINTIRFNTLLAMQFSAYRQRIITGFDPRATDENGNFLYKTNADGTPQVDANGNAIPVLNTPGRAGVDRILAFPGGDTKVFDLAESNLANYVAVLNAFLTQLFSTGQIPPQYLLNQMSNLSGDALAGAESTLSSLVQDLQSSAAAGNAQLSQLAWRAMGHAEPFDPGTETRWADAEARSFAQVADAVVKLISTGFPRQDAWEMLPGATPEKLTKWLSDYQDEQDQNIIALASRPLLAAAGNPASAAPADGSTGNTDSAVPLALGAGTGATAE